jgi:hypothetical protein
MENAGSGFEYAFRTRTTVADPEIPNLAVMTKDKSLVDSAGAGDLSIMSQ